MSFYKGKGFIMEKFRKGFLYGIIFYDKGRKGRREFVLHWIINLAFLLLFSAAMGVLSLRLGTANYGAELFESFFGFSTRGLALLFFNLAPVCLLTLFLFFAFNRAMPAVLISGGFTLLLSCVNYFKLAFRDDPMLASDISFFTEALKISAGYETRLTQLMWFAVFLVIAGGVFAHFFMRARISRRAVRIFAPGALLLLSLVLYFSLFTNASLYARASNTLVEFSDGWRMNYWSDTDQYCSRGFIYPFIYSTTNMGSKKPEDYDKKAAQAIMDAEAILVSTAGGEQVNFISIMLEAYCDFSEFGLSFSENPYEYFHQIQEGGYSGELVTNIFAGGTIDTERCFITGSTAMYEYRGAAYSFARYFDERGYFTQFCHPGYGWFYNRQNVMEYLGFESLHFFEDRYDIGTGYLMEDGLFFADLISLFEESVAAGMPYFNFSVTYQNHGPYDAGELSWGSREFVAQGDLSDYSYYVLNNYLSGIKRTDDALSEFFSYFEESEEPCVIVLFGDHKPWLGDSNIVYAELGVDFSFDADAGFYSYYNTPYVIWANEAAKMVLGNDFSGEGEDFSPAFLMPKVFELCGFSDSVVANELMELYRALPVVHVSGRFREGDDLSYDISGEARGALSRFLNLQHYFSFDMY